MFSSLSNFVPFSYKAFVDVDVSFGNITTAAPNHFFQSSGSATTSIWTWSINDDLVLTTWILFTLIFSLCLYSFINRSLKKRPKKDSESQQLLTASPETSTSAAAEDQRSPDVEAPAVDAGDDSDTKSTFSQTLESEGKRFIQDAPENTTDASSLLGTEMGLGDRISKQPIDLSSPDLTLLHTLKDVLTQGIILTQYTTGSAKQVKVFLNGNVLQWRSAKFLARKNFKLDLRKVLCVEWGKKTSNFHLPLAAKAPIDCCFSFLTDDQTLDFEASSKVERDALAQGFTLMLEDLRLRSSSSSISTPSQ